MVELQDIGGDKKAITLIFRTRQREKVASGISKYD
jgi:hypothetical protein